MSTINEQPPAKRQNRSLGASDRITVDVGGTKFITSVSTLTSNSAYFESLLSDNWIESNNGDDEVFIDQDPDPFKVLLAYMRSGMVKIDDISTEVLILAEFLGVERLLLAVKIRWYHNIGRGPVLTTADEIAAAFDQKYGGIMKAISAGLFPYFLKQDDINADKDYVILKNFDHEDDPEPEGTVKIEEVGKEGPDLESSFNTALDWLHLKGYTYHEKQLDTCIISKETRTFSRRRHSALQSDAIDIFIPDDSVKQNQEESGYVKQFALHVINRDTGNEGVSAPAEFREDESERSDPLIGAFITQFDNWLEKHGFMTREEEYEDLFRRYWEGNLEYKIFSRMITSARE